MNFNAAFDRTLKHYGISAKSLSIATGISQQAISDFRRDKSAMNSDNLERLLWALPEEARNYYFKQLGVVASGEVWNQLDRMGAEELSQLVAAIARRIPQVSQRELQKV